MRSLKSFESFIEDGTVAKISPDLNRASFLKKESAKRKAFLDEIQEKIGLSKDNANYVIENSYNIILEFLRGKMLEMGYSASGTGAHEAEVSFMKILLFPDNDVKFMDEVRFFRNGILYHGKILDKEYAEKVLNFLNKIYPKLEKL